MAEKRVTKGSRSGAASGATSGATSGGPSGSSAQAATDPAVGGDAVLIGRTIESLAQVDAAAWDRLIPPGPGGVFLRHAWLEALEASGCVGGDSGWMPQHLLIHPQQAPQDLRAAMPLYLKDHSYGEYVFDWAWADAYHRAGLNYYPKLLSAIPFTPVTGPRCLGDPDLASALCTSLAQIVDQQELSSAHVLLPQDVQAPAPSGWLRRTGVQFHWRNAGFVDFEAFLASLAQPKRKKIRAERRKAQEAGVRCRWLAGRDIGEADWRFFMRCYAATYQAHHSTPYLNLAFFERAHAAMPEAFVMIISQVEGRDVAASLLIRDGDRLYGRHWGAIAQVPFMHFEVAYYQSIDFAIAQGCQVIEGGAQGEHKMARGFLPTPTASWHYLRDSRFADAVERYLAREDQGMAAYLDELNERNPFKAAPAGESGV